MRDLTSLKIIVLIYYLFYLTLVQAWHLKLILAGVVHRVEQLTVRNGEFKSHLVPFERDTTQS